MDTIIIIDLGSQYNQLIARRVRENSVFCRIVSPKITISEIKKIAPKGLILSGGPASVYEKGAPRPDKAMFSLGIPILGICYGMQLMAKVYGGKVSRAHKREYGHARLIIDSHKTLFRGLPKSLASWMSHGDHIKHLPKDFKRVAHTANTAIAAMSSDARKLYGVQFHPEVAHTEKGGLIIKNFVKEICGSRPSWDMKSFIKDSVAKVRKNVGKTRVVLGLSGGVDSSVTAVLLHKAIGRNLTCIFVDNGLLRKGERERVTELFRRNFNLNLKVIDARKRFLSALKGVTDPEKKRKIIGGEFIKVFEKEARRIKRVKFLAQGTLYPDLIESQSAFGGPSATIKTHHNVGGLPKKMRLKLIEPLKYLFKDEVRRLGEELRMPHSAVWRQPFPGPGLAVRIVGEVTEERLRMLKEADYRLMDIIKKKGLYNKLWQSFAVLLPIKSVGVMGDQRTYENAIAVRAVTSTDGMTANWAHISHEILAEISNGIINEVKGVNRVVYDISSKPPSTIEWE
ncbi:MAG: glutamine-hydrolyzing GMP synthase [Candidatus Omnitrophica bacterium]|nr:glutamine-hydrolyzing GMP synthase [Candidatus Omnitrophota bacterium]MBU4488831.1 glutamine-hydrolyzing GMP synthase [Candidatus Omnitrophota bacterium]MCG2704514.1 glutamine-hydrolyzing GMP synthase [Candidatus Omnitrophota bacterium]